MTAWLPKPPNQTRLNRGCGTHCGPLIVFVNKVLLAHSPPHSCTYFGWSSIVTTETVWPTKHEILTMWPFTGRTLIPKVCIPHFSPFLPPPLLIQARFTMLMPLSAIIPILWSPLGKPNYPLPLSLLQTESYCRDFPHRAD